jgi:type IV secretion system protein TrbE
VHCIGPWPEAAWLSDCETLTYLHSCISTRRQRVRVPEAPMYLDAWSTSRWSQGSRRGSPRADLLTLIVMGFPLVTYPGILIRMKEGEAPGSAHRQRFQAYG